MQPKFLVRSALTMALLSVIAGCGKGERAMGEAEHAPSRAVAAAPMAPASRAAGDALAKGSAQLEARGAAAADAAATAPANALNPAEMEAPLSSSAASSSYADGERKFIRSAHAHFRVSNVYQSALAIEDAAAGQGGFVVKNDIASNVQRIQRRPVDDAKVIELAEYVVHGQLVVRVPSNKTQDFLRSIANQVAFLDQRSFDARDAQFDLLRQQLDFKRSQEMQEELAQATREGGKLSHKSEAIATRNEAKAARDRARVAQKEFEDQIAFSTIRLSLYQLPNLRQTEVLDIEELFRQGRPGIGTRLAKSVAAGWDGTLELVVQLVKLWPLWMVLAAAVFGWRRFKPLRRRAPASAE